MGFTRILQLFRKPKANLEDVEIGLVHRMVLTKDVWQSTPLALISCLELLGAGRFALTRKTYYRALKSGDQSEKKPRGIQIPVLLRGESYRPDESGLSLEEGQCIKLSLALEILKEAHRGEAMRDGLMKPLMEAGGLDRKLWKKMQYQPTEELARLLKSEGELLELCVRLVEVRDDVSRQYSDELDRLSKELSRTGKKPRQRFPKIDYQDPALQLLLERMGLRRDQLEWLLFASVSMYDYAQDYRTEPNQRLKSVRKSRASSGGSFESDWLDSIVDPIPYD